MKLTHNHQREREQGPSIARICAAGCENVREAVAGAKENLLTEYRALVGEHLHLLRLALNEAEALAWDTEFPHLFFPTLAMEKARATVAWHRRQRAINPAAESAFAE
jgi:hypothetical protein